MYLTLDAQNYAAKKVSFAYQSTGIKRGALSLEVFLQLSFLIEGAG